MIPAPFVEPFVNQWVGAHLNVVLPHGGADAASALEGRQLGLEAVVVVRFLVVLIAVDGFGFRVKASGFRVQGSGFRVQGAGFRVQGSGFRVQGAGFKVLVRLGFEAMVVLVLIMVLVAAQWVGVEGSPEA